MDWEIKDELEEENAGVQEVRDLFQQLLERDKLRRVVSTEEREQEEEPQPESFPSQPAIIDWTTLSYMPEDESEEDSIMAGEYPFVLNSDAVPEKSVAAGKDDVWDEEPEEDEEQFLPPPPVVRRNPFRVLWESFVSNLPHKQDKGNSLIQKVAFLVAVLMLLGLVGCVLFDVAVQPALNRARYEELAATYKMGQKIPTMSAEYPAGMLEAFCPLYNKNPQVRGWIKYTSTDSVGFLDIQYPILQSGDNTKYVKCDFYEKSNQHGALFFHKDASLETADAANKVLLVYGNNARSGQMLAGLNQFIDNIRKAKSAPTFALSTLFASNQYKVFAVVLTDEDASGDAYFDAERTSFANNGEFMRYVQELRARSLYDYPVDVVAGDRLVILSTSATHSTSKLSNGRLLVVARQMRTGESAKIDTGLIRENEDVIMPRAWYDKNHVAPHAYYTDASYKMGEETYTTTTTGISMPLGGLPNTTQADGNTSQTQTAATNGGVTGVTTTTTAGTGASTTPATTTAAPAAGDNVVGTDS